MGRRRMWTKISVVASLSAVLLGAFSAPVIAKTAEPPVSTRAWYWEEANSQEITLPTGEKVTVDSPNPFCPVIPGQLGAVPAACAEGRLPVEIRDGDYETPNKLSAVNFDLSLVPIGSKVSKFTATFYEAKPGCYDNDGDGQQDFCETTEPLNVEGKELQACLINSFFGDGDARPYPEAPKYTCTKADPTAKRKEVETKDGEVEHVWQFDLTKYAQAWIKDFTTNTSVMLVGKYPNDYKPGDTDPTDNWRVVLVGPKAPEGKLGVVTEIAFTPGETVVPPSDPTTSDPTTTTGGTSTGGDISTTTGSGSIDTGSSDIGGSTDSGGASTPTDTESPAADTLAVEGATATPQGLPTYVWLAVLAGFICWSVFRSVILESAKGIRPDGVLAQIQAINAQRRGGAGIAVDSGPSPIATFFGGVKRTTGSLLGKLKLTRKG
ncbi:MAG TPA: hypothetical protein VE174_07130 [Actinomycetota bacterium]|nr:hypothetical protein [Actinomycetota bacterium]